MFINGTDLNGDSIMDLIVGLSTGGLKVLYGSRVNSISELSVFDQEQESALKIYPNPTEGGITIEVLEKTFGGTNTIEISVALNDQFRYNCKVMILSLLDINSVVSVQDYVIYVNS